MVSTPGAQLNGHFIQHYVDDKPYFIINVWKLRFQVGER
jgi:hypothetical protein